ncbi:MAG TPA: protein kinase [Thermoanaerobaculia bacterium]
MSDPAAVAQGVRRAGSFVGGYEIRSRLGAGGMGEVYRARDTRLGRDVALKFLPEEFAKDVGRVRRFEAEARAASALSDPNIVTVYDVGSSESVSYIAMELVEGKTLREILASGALPLKKILDVAVQIASGLARAHGAGIVHRDLKPENVMISKDGLVKILDFGLAKRMPFEGEAGPDRPTLTQEGTVVGTVGYMSPEQAEGQPVDFRSDQFSFGSILYEMATGKRSFYGKSAVRTLAAIVNEEPEPIEKTNPKVPAPLRWIVGRCLAKDPPDRYASTQDLVQELKVLRDHLSEVTGEPAATATHSRPAVIAGLIAAAIVAALAGMFLAGRNLSQRPSPDFQRLTFGQGAISSARFAPDGRTIVYGATNDGAPVHLFSTRTDGRDSTRLELPDADVVSVSSAGEIAMVLGFPFEPQTGFAGTLARVPLTGGAPREMTEGITGADWSPDGRGLVISRKVGKSHRLEFPIGKVLYETTGRIDPLRFSPNGDRIAFLVRSSDEGGGVSIEVVDLAGNHRVLSKGWKRGNGLAWSADGREVWFSVNESGLRAPLYAVTLTGKQRIVMRLPAYIKLQDVSRDGRTLVSLAALRSKIQTLRPGETRERDLSWHEVSMVKGMTPDGKTILFDEGSEGYFHTFYVRPMDGSPAKRIGEGRSLAISPDGRWVAANSAGRGSPVWILPTGPGDPMSVGVEGHKFEEAVFFPDGKRLLLLARDPGQGARTFLKDLPAGALRPVAPEGVSCLVVSPDGESAACTGPRGEGLIYSIEGGAARSIPGFKAGQEDPVMWASDGQSLFVGSSGLATSQGTAPFTVSRLDIRTGRREIWHEFKPADRAGVIGAGYYFSMTPDGKSYAYSYLSAPSDLYLVTGLK